MLTTYRESLDSIDSIDYYVNVIVTPGASHRNEKGLGAFYLRKPTGSFDKIAGPEGPKEIGDEGSNLPTY
jgi:hypothetical protein